MRHVHQLIAVGLLSLCAAAGGACFSSSKSGPAETGDSGTTPPPSSGGTGAFGIVTINGKQKMYLPQSSVFDADSGTSHGVISVVDIGASAASTEDGSFPADSGGPSAVPALLKTIVLPNAVSDSATFQTDQYATATGGDSSVVVAVSKSCQTIWFIDPNTDTVTGTLVLDSTYGQSSFSGGGGYVTGVAVDSPHNRAILSVWNGFAVVNLATKSIQTTILAPPAENFGYDSVTQRIYSPFYGCTSSSPGSTSDGAPAQTACNTPKGPDGMTVMTDGLQVIDLSDPTYPVYTYEGVPGADAASAIAFGYDPNLPVGSEPDSASVDPTTQVVVVPSEGDSLQSVIEMSQAVFDKASLTVTAPRHVIDTSAVSDLDAVAIEPHSHIALWEQEFGSQVAATDLTLASAGNVSWAYATMPPLPNGNGFSNVGDPHGLAVTTSLIGGEPVGFVVDQGLRWIGRIDFAQIAKSAVGDAGVSLDPGSILSSDAGIGVGIRPYVTYLDALAQE